MLLVVRTNELLVYIDSPMDKSLTRYVEKKTRKKEDPVFERYFPFEIEDTNIHVVNTHVPVERDTHLEPWVSSCV